MSPSLHLRLAGASRVTTTLPYEIEFTISREEDDGRNEPCIFRWSPVAHGLLHARFSLLRDTPHGEESVPVTAMDVSTTCGSEEPDIFTIEPKQPFRDFIELNPGQALTVRRDLQPNYQKLLQSGSKYHLFWPGMEIPLWDWGTVEGHMGQTIISHVLKPLDTPELILPASNRLTFVASEEEDPWPQRAEHEANWGFASANVNEFRWRRDQIAKRAMEIRGPSPPPIRKAERMLVEFTIPIAPARPFGRVRQTQLTLWSSDGAPILKVTVQPPTNTKKREAIQCTVTVTFAGVKGGQKPPAEGRPIVFYTHLFRALWGPREGFRTYHHRTRDGVVRWEEVKASESCGFILVSDEPIYARVGSDDSNFVQLQPNQSWVTQHMIIEAGGDNVSEDARTPGSRFRYLHKGGTVEWWDWGTKEDHADTVVQLSELGGLHNKEHNHGRPKMIVARSNAVEFCLT